MGKSKFDRVRYLRTNRISIEIVHTLTEHDKALFLDQQYEWFQQLEQGQEIELVDTGNATLNIALREERTELQEGFITYMENATKRKKKDAIPDTSGIEPGCITDLSGIDSGYTPDPSPAYPSEQTKQEDIHIQTINQIKSDLIPCGYKSTEIEKAYRSVDDWTEIGNPSGYIRKIIDNERKRPSKKTLPAQDFPQRNYDDVPDEMMKSLALEIEEFRKGEGQ